MVHNSIIPYFLSVYFDDMMSSSLVQHVSHLICYKFRSAYAFMIVLLEYALPKCVLWGTVCKHNC